MANRSRRDFLGDLGKGMLAISIGPALANELGLFSALARDAPARLNFGSLDELAALMQETDGDAIIPLLHKKLAAGASLAQLIAAGALANARTFGGQDYIGYHAFMALMPAYRIALALEPSRQALPVFKVLHRNTRQIREHGGPASEVLHPLATGEKGARPDGPALFRHMVKPDMDGAERTFAALAAGNPDATYQELQHIVQDEVDVHRVVLAWRAWETLDLTGREHAHTLLRQSVRFCVEREEQRLARGRPEPPIRSLLPKLLEKHGFATRKAGTLQPETAWVEELARTIVAASPSDAAAAVAEALANDVAPEVIGETLSVAATELLLHDPGRSSDEPGKPRGSVHGPSVGVHASDSANAWRNIARVSNPRNAFASLIVGGYHTAGQSDRVGKEPFPYQAELARLETESPGELQRELLAAVTARDQPRAGAIAARWTDLGHDPAPVFATLREVAVSQDGALHAEKYYHTVVEEFRTTRAELRPRHLIALARVSASESGHPAPGHAQACRVLELDS